ncbi:MAG TPA: methyltransferase domain-containing protein [Gemmatimonadaceae bacterium]|nr:methyltransferase domain-containing protein [Gemmatimonadaceae bacterium]
MPAYEIAPCPVCGAKDGRQIAGEEEIRAEVEALWEFHGARLRPETPPAHLADRVAFSQRPPLRVVQCTECGLVYRNPRERAFELRDIYAGEAPDERVLGALFETQRGAYAAQARRLTESAGGKLGRGLEVGSYVGGFLTAAAELGWRFEGVDLNPTANAFARARGLRVTDGDLDSYDGAPGFDAVAIWNCFDQLAEPRAAARRARELLRDGGLLAVRVPNGAFYAAVRRQLDGPGAPLARALLAHNNLLTFPYRHGFTPAALARLLGETGFSVERLFGDTLVPIADEWTQPWAAWEERVVKGALREIARDEADAAPWLEMYAKAA